MHCRNKVEKAIVMHNEYLGKYLGQLQYKLSDKFFFE